MLASRGFVYHSETAAGFDGHYHPNCDCRIVPGFDGMEVQGYDPDSLYTRFKDCYDAVADDAGHADMDAVLAEMRTRDSEWLNYGTPCKVTKEAGAKPMPKERTLAETLSNHGFSVEFIKEINTYKVKTPDAWLNGVKCEFKIPEGYGEKTTKNQFKKAVGKGTGFLVISCEENDASVSEVAEDVASVFASQEYEEITQVLIVGADEKLRRLKRE